MSSEKSSNSTKSCYQITICQDGKFAITFDTVNLRIKVLENTDYRPFKSRNDPPQIPSESEKFNKTIAHFKINYDFTIKEVYEPKTNANVEGESAPTQQGAPEADNNKFRWSFDISNLHQKKHKYFILVAVSRMNVDEDMKEIKEKEDNKNDTRKRDYVTGYLKRVKHTTNGTTRVDIPEGSENAMHKGTAIYYLELEKKQIEEKESEEQKEKMASEKEQKKETKDSYILSTSIDFFRTDVSGICKFINIDDKLKPDKSESDRVEQDRFLILNFHGIYNFKFSDSSGQFDPFAPKGTSLNLNEKFNYPNSIRRELDNWYTNNDCMRRLRSCIYNKYFMVTQYKDDVQSLEVYNLAKMELETSAKRVENKDKFVKRYNYNTFSVSRLQFCFTRGVNSILLYYMENGLQIASKKFNQIEKIYSLEFIDSDEKLLIIGKDRDENLKFITWDLYYTNRVESVILSEFHKCPIEELDSHLTITSGNILHIDDNGNVTSILKKIENKLREKQEREPKPDGDAGDAELVKSNNDDKHKIYYNKNIMPNFNEDYRIISKFNKIADEVEPWVSDDYEKNSYCLYYNKKETEIEFMQLIVGRSTVQIWHQIYDDYKNDKLPNKGEPFLEYIWTNGIPVDQESEETRLQIDFKYGSNNDGANKDLSNNGKDKSNCKLNNFSLEVYWNIIKESEKAEDKKVLDKKHDTINRSDITGKFRGNACKALEYLNKRYKKKNLMDHYNKVHKYEEIVTYIKHIVWRFAKYNPEHFRLLDVRHNLMKNLILGDCDHLIKFILFGDEENIDNENVNGKKKEKKEGKKQKEIRHVPRNILWPGEKFIQDDGLDFEKKDNGLQDDNEQIKLKNNMELAIYHCKGRELKDTIIVAYLLEYYSEHATDCAGWMSTVSKAIPLLFKYNYDDYARKLFRKECFADHDHFLAQDPDEIIPEQYLARRNHNIKFRAFRPMVKLKSDQQKLHNKIFKPFESLKNRICEGIEDFDSDLGKSPLALRVVPLPDFTTNSILNKKVEYNFTRIILNIFWLILIPRWYRIGRNDRNRLSSFSRMILYENIDDIYDNPATEAIIDFRWQKARNFFWLLFIRFLIYAFSFGAVSWKYLNHNADVNVNGNFIAALIVIFYYLAIYQLITEVLQLAYNGFRKYFGEIFNIFDIISIIFSIIIMSMMVKNFQFSNGFGSVEMVDTGLMVGISFSILFLWIELIFYLRLLSGLGIYIYYFIITFKTIFPFFVFILIVIFAFGHTMFFLLRNPDNINTKDTTFSGNATNTLTNETLNIELKTDFDSKSSTDNPFSHFPATMMAAYFWIDSNWVQRDNFDFWAVDLFTFIISVVVVIYLQNMLIAFMSGVFEKAETKSRQTLLRQRANHIADYEALHHIHFWKHEPDPKYIYYFGQSKNFEDWIRKADQDAVYKDFEKKTTRIFKERDYDKYNDNELKIKKAENIKNDVNTNFEYLIEIFKEFGNQEVDEKIKRIKINTNNKVEKLIKNLTIKKF